MTTLYIACAALVAGWILGATGLHQWLLKWLPWGASKVR